MPMHFAVKVQSIVQSDYDFSKVSVSIHSFTVNSVQIAIAGLIKIELSRENIVLHACDSLIIILIFHGIDFLLKYCTR